MILDDPKANHDCLGIQEALNQAIEQNFVELLQYLITREDVSISGEFNGKSRVAQEGNLSIFKLLKERGAVWGQNQCQLLYYRDSLIFHQPRPTEEACGLGFSDRMANGSS
ncbi:uncharacterized protein CLUP02_08586 [Colletotrichum lupini]|uniref:Uncharacterized protein n=1 Tax=Colletotrichum lupini TaxID=145971 RepID=A0A9Q8WGR8_9PEZI|nr:uncharacterized protein CLUP02_08586 [Colletotrichum lupini]UQC83093.1 hypothetical protein CLUP02_08586 [Colletotrichum lupini]